MPLIGRVRSVNRKLLVVSPAASNLQQIRMAKLGEGDPRWLVEERRDGTNVNGWHWVERDCLDWSKQRLAELVSGMRPLGDSSDKQLTITGLDSVTGEAIVNNRKQKIIPAYELDIKFNWEGSVNGQEAKGKVHLPYVADENHDEQPELRFACSTNDAASEQLKQAFLQGPGKQVFLEKVQQFVKELRAGGPMAAGSTETATAAGKDSQAPKVKLTSADPQAVRPAAAAAKPKAAAGKTALHLKEQFYCKAQDIYDCFTQEGRVKAFTQSNATIDPKVGGTFSWFGGTVQGTFTDLVPGKRIAMDWRFSSWADDCVSKVVLTLDEPEPGHTFVKLDQTDIPEADRFHDENVHENTEKGWRVQIFLRIRQVFGYGLGL